MNAAGSNGSAEVGTGAGTGFSEVVVGAAVMVGSTGATGAASAGAAMFVGGAIGKRCNNAPAAGSTTAAVRVVVGAAELGTIARAAQPTSVR